MRLRLALDTLKCWIGFHPWVYVDVYPDGDLNAPVMTCRRYCVCGKRQVYIETCMNTGDWADELDKPIP